MRVPRRAHCRGAAIRAGRTGSGVGHRYHLHSDSESWRYLDLFSRFAAGWVTSERITDDLTLDALDMALAPAPPPGLLLHSDRGSQAASTEYQRVLVQHAIVCSMSRRDVCWDNWPESFFATLKVELVMAFSGRGRSSSSGHTKQRQLLPVSTKSGQGQS